MQKILVLTNSINGLYSFRRELIAKLLEKNFKVIISTPYDNDKRISYFKKIGCSLIDTKLSRRGTNPFADFKLLVRNFRLMNRIKPDIVLTYTIKPNIYGGIVCRLKNVFHIANITGLGTAVEDRGLLQKITLSLYKTALKKSNCIFFQNQENMDFMNSYGIGKGNSRLIPGSGVNLTYFKLLDYPKSDNINFLFIGRVMKEKGIEQYLDTAIYIKKKYPNTIFHVVGRCEESYISELNKMQENGIIRYHGFQDNIIEYYKISHCIIHPTYYPEGMSNVLLESAACGRPIITTDRSGCREIVDDSINGFLVKQQNSRDLIDKVEKFLNLDYEDKRKMGLAGRAKVELEFDRQIVIDAYLEEIDRLMGVPNEVDLK